MRAITSPRQLTAVLLVAAPLVLISLTPADADDGSGAPRLQIVASPVPAYDVWRTDTVTVKVEASDPDGVREVRYLMSGATESSGTLAPDGGTITISNQGHTVLDVRATDNEGNESAEMLEVGVDRTSLEL